MLQAETSLAHDLELTIERPPNDVTGSNADGNTTIVNTPMSNDIFGVCWHKDQYRRDSTQNVSTHYMGQDISMQVLIAACSCCQECLYL